MGTASNNNSVNSQENYMQWLSINEVSLFLHDGLIRASDLIDIPEENIKSNRATSGTSSSEFEHMNEVIAFDTRNPKELSDRILSLCGTENNAFVRLVNYRLNALQGLWNAQKQMAVEQAEKAVTGMSTALDDAFGNTKKQTIAGFWPQSEPSSFTSRLGLLMVLPLLRSQSRTDPTLCGTTTRLLLQCLLECPPHSLSKEPEHCLNGLEELLCSWLEEVSVGNTQDLTETRMIGKGLEERESVASALVALASARGCLRGFITTLHLLHNLPDIKSLPVACILRKLFELEGGPGCWSSLVGNRHVICWGFEDMLPVAVKKEGADKDAEFGRSLATDGRFLYTTNSSGSGLAKIGTGFSGTLRGFVYNKINDLGPGRVACSDSGLLLIRPHDFDTGKEYNRLAVVVNPQTLTLEDNIYIPCSVAVKSVVTTIQFCSDGHYFYWIWCPGNSSDKSIKSQSIFVDTFLVKSGQSEAVAVTKRVILQRKDDAANKSFNEAIMSMLRPYRPSGGTNLVVLSSNPGTPFVPTVQDGNAAVSSCGIPLKSLLRVPIYVCGNAVVVLSTTPAGITNVSSRSPFGNGSTLANLRPLASCHCFNLKDGIFVGRSELYDAPTCSLARGVLISGMAACYDSKNNVIWTCSSEWIDYFLNPGHQAVHHVNRRLKIDEGYSLSSQDDRLSLPEVIRQLLQHVGSLCCHQSWPQIFDPFISGSVINQQQQHFSLADTAIFVKILDMLEMAIRIHDEQIICCNLIILQVICKSFKMGLIALDNSTLKRTRSLLWQLLTCEMHKTSANANGNQFSTIQTEACNVFCSALSVLYSAREDHEWIHNYLLTEGSKFPILLHLRELIMSDYAERLKLVNVDMKELPQLILSDKLLDMIMSITVEESCGFIRNCFQYQDDEFGKWILSLPYASPCVQYLCALQNHLFRRMVCEKITDEIKEISDVPKTLSTFEDLPSIAINFAQRVLIGARKVFEVLIDVCETKSGYPENQKRFQQLERAVKSTILGYLLPILITALYHSSVQHCSTVSTLVPHLVRLIFLSSRTALLLKKHTQGAQQQSETIPQVKNENCENVELEKQEEMGFLDGLKIPAPWARGSTLESIHPVRDNYKLKETIHIPGARCLYLRYDPRCSSQYDYDKLLVYAGPDTNGHKVAEYGGNTYGYGSRSVLGAGWPKDLVKIEGDTVTFAFEMRSGREHNTPDKAMWGFLVTVRAQESLEVLANGLPFVTDLALGLTVLASDILQLLYRGPNLSPEEINAEILLKSQFLQRCVCSVDTEMFTNTVVSSTVDDAIDENTEMSTDDNTTLRISTKTRLSAEFLHRLRQLSGCVAPQLRPSIRSVIHVDQMEDHIMLAVLKHANLPNNINSLLKLLEQTECQQKFSNFLSQAYQKLDALTRRLQALAELEQRWQSEVEDIRQGMMPASMAFFADYHFSDLKTKELSMLCFLKGVDMEGSNAEVVVHNLREKLENEAYNKEILYGNSVLPFAKTRQLVSTILQRAEILCMVTLESNENKLSTLLICGEEEIDGTITSSKPTYSRSISAPCPASDLLVDKNNGTQLPKNKRLSGLWGRYSTSILGDIQADADDSHYNRSVQPPSLLDQLFAILSSQPEKNISPKDFKSATDCRKLRGISRRQSLVYMKELITATLGVGGANHLLAAVTSVLLQGPQTDQLTCSGMILPVREAFADTIASVVKLASCYPLACSNSIGLLCVIPYTKSEERCLVNSGLVHLLDWMCSLSDHRSNTSSDPKNLRQRVAAMAWAGFQVLSNCCVSWETEDEDEYLRNDVDQKEPSDDQSGLAQQIATLLTNHLARATDNNGDDTTGNEALQEVLSLLNNLSKSQMGKAILSQPTCVSKLLSLLLDQRPSPKLVLVILQLCRSALPLMSAEDCDKVNLPAWGSSWGLDNSMTNNNVPSQIVSLLLAKLADFVIPGFPATSVMETTTPDLKASQKAKDEDASSSASASEASAKGRFEENDPLDGRFSVYLYRRDDQSVHDVIHPLLGGESRLYRLSGSNNIERIERITRELNKYGRAEMCTEDALTALRRAAKWAQSGMIVSTGPAVEKDNSESSSDKKRTTSDVICKEKNVKLAKSDPVRSFISGQVANSMASEVIALLHELLKADTAAKIWTSSICNVLGKALSCLAQTMKHIDVIGTSHGNVMSYLQTARKLLASLCALGGFKPTLKVGSEVLVLGEGSKDHQTCGVIVALADHHRLATIKLNLAKIGDSNHCYSGLSCESTCRVPVSRLVPIQSEQLPLDELGLLDQVVHSLHVFLMYESERKPLLPIPDEGDECVLPMTIARIAAEIRTRAFMVLAVYLKNDLFCKKFLSHSFRSMEITKNLALECLPSDRNLTTENRCERLRMLFRDCAKPPIPPVRTNGSKTKEIAWNTTKGFPPVRASLFSHGLTGITFLGDPSISVPGLPRGTFLYASQAIPQQAPSFYWELEICSLRESHDDGAPVVSFGFAPQTERKEGGWTNPVGTVLFHNNGRAVHYNGSSLLLWKSVQLEVNLATGDVAGCGWERTDCLPELLGCPAKGNVFFTHNGQRLTSFIEDVTGGVYPVVHIQKKNTRVKANFGARPFAYAEGLHHVTAAHKALESTEEISAAFGLLPFSCCSDSESDVSENVGLIDDGSDERSGCRSVRRSSKHLPTALSSVCKVSTTIEKVLHDYDYGASSRYVLSPSNSNLLFTGPNTHQLTAVIDIEDNLYDDQQQQQQQEDHYALLVKAWESKVFPVIRRRFRNESERKDGLEQIRGALQLGMTDIARQTVEFLYEENGGIPRDLHLPTIEDIKEEMSRITLDRIKKGTEVLIRNLSASNTTDTGVTVLPKYAVPGMLKTFGLLAVVLDIDHQNELVQLETYLRSEGVLVRFWYPLDVLERPPVGLNQTSITAGTQVVDTSSTVVHQELLHWENALSRIYCRAAFLEMSRTASHFFITEEVDRLQLLSDDLLSPSCINGTVLDRCLTSCQSSRQALRTDSCFISDLFYNDVESIRWELTKIINQAISAGEEQLFELTKQITSCLQPNQCESKFRCEQFEISDSKIVTDVHMVEAAFLVVSCKVDHSKNHSKSNSSSSSSNIPWARVFSYSGQDFKRNGQASRQEVISYPYLTSSSSSNAPASGTSTEFPYPTIILSCDRIHLRLGGCSCTEVYLAVHSVPSNFPIALAYLEVLLRWKWPSSLKTLTCKILSTVVDTLCNFIGKVDIPARLKECVFHLLAEALKCLLSTEEDLSNIDSPSLALLSLLQMELKRLYEEESHANVGYGGETNSAQQTTDHNIRFSSYFHSLMEVCLAMAEISGCSSSKPFGNSVRVVPSGLYGTCATAMALSSTVGGSVVGGVLSGTGAAPPSPSAGSKRKKIKAKRDRASPKSRSGSNSPSSTLVDGGESQASTSTNSLGTAKVEELLWFHRAVAACEMLRVVVEGRRNKSSIAIDDAIANAAQVILPNTAHERLLIISGIPKHLSHDVVRRAIEKALRSVGGTQRGKMFVGNASIKIDHPSLHCHSSASHLPFSDDDELGKTTHSFAVVEIKVKAKMEAARKALLRCKALLDGGSLELGLMTEEVMDLTDNNISILTVKENLQLSDPDDNYVLEEFLKNRLYADESLSELNEDAVSVLTDIFHSCFITDQHLSFRDVKEESGFICLSREQIANHTQGNLLHQFFSAAKPAKNTFADHISGLLQSYGFLKKEDKECPVSEKLSPERQAPKKSSLKKPYKEKYVLARQTDKSDECEKSDVQEEKCKLDKTTKDDNGLEEKFYLTLDGFLQYVSAKGQTDITSVWMGLLACGYDWHYDRCCCVDVNQAQQMANQWTLEMDCALVQHVDLLCRKFVISPCQLHPHEIYVSAAELSAPEYVCLQGLSTENLRLRTAFLQSLNTTLEYYFLPFVDLRPGGYSHSVAKLLSRARGVIFHDTKIVLMNHVLNFTALRKSDQAAPEIVLDPLEVIGNDVQEMSNSQFCQAMRKLDEIPSSQFCVQLASGGDPTYSFNVKLVGEEVHGTSGSFRHFLSQVSRELQSPVLPLLAPCPSAAANRNKGKYILQPGSLNYPEEKMLQFFGQLLGITIRAGIPLPVELVPAFWKRLVDVPLDPVCDLQDVDLLTYNYIKEFDLVENARDLSQLLEEHHNPHFVYTSLNGDKFELCPDGQNIPVCWENHSNYVDAIRKLRMNELSSPEHYLAIKAGFASIIPIQLVYLLTPLDLEIRTCGVPYVDLDFLKVHTMYQVGLTETDPHIRFFWNTLDSLSQEELRKFIKFACNQDRVPLSCPCKDGRQDIVHVPPYPMKIAPPEGRTGTPDSRYIRAETCMFMLKLPQYSTQEIMTERLLYAINCRDDPLSG